MMNTSPFPCRSSRRRATPLLGCLLGFSLVASPLHAANRTWSYEQPTWSAPGAWNGAIATNRDIFFFNRSGSGPFESENDLTDFIIHGLEFGVGAGAHHLHGNALSIATSRTITNQSNASQTIALDLDLLPLPDSRVSTTTFLNVDPAGKLIFTGIISGAAANLVAINGPGTTVFTGQNTYAGLTNLNGNLLLDYSLTTSEHSILAESNKIVASFGTLSIKGRAAANVIQKIDTLTIQSGSLGNIVTESPATGSTQLQIKTLALDARGILSVDNSLGGSVSIETTPTFYTNQRFSGILVRDSGGIGFATLGAGNVLTRATDAIALPTNGSETALTGNYAVSGNHTLTGPTSLHTLEIDASAPESALIADGALQFSGSGGILMRGDGHYTLSSTRLAAGHNGTIHFHLLGAGSLTLDTTLTASHSIVKNGAGRLIVDSEANAFDGVFSVTQGIVQLNHDMEKSRFYLAVENGLQFKEGIGTFTIGFLHSSPGATGVRQILEDMNGEAITLRIGSQSANYSGSLYGSGSLLVYGGVQTFGGFSDYTGGTRIEGGTLQLSQRNTLSQTGDIVIAGGNLGVSGTGSFNLNQQTSGKIELISGAIYSNTNGSNRGTVTKLGGGFFEMHSGEVGTNVILAGTNAGLQKLSSGTVYLHSYNSTYTGETQVQAGTLIVNGNILQSSGFTVSAGATLGGNGSVTRISGAGTVAPGNSPGMLTAPDVDPTAGLDFSFEFTRAATSGTSAPNFADLADIGNDVLRLTEATPFTASLTSANVITVDFTGLTLAIGEVYLGGFFAENDFADALTNATFQFIGADDFTFSVSTLAHTAAFAGGPVDGYITAFEVEAIPEPGTVALLLGSGIFLLGAWRKQWKMVS